MAEYRIQETGAVVTESELRAMHPNTSFPYVLTEELVNDLGADVVFEGPQPTATKYQVVYRDGVEQIEGKWYTKYSVAVQIFIYDSLINRIELKYPQSLSESELC